MEKDITALEQRFELDLRMDALPCSGCVSANAIAFIFLFVICVLNAIRKMRWTDAGFTNCASDGC